MTGAAPSAGSIAASALLQRPEARKTAADAALPQRSFTPSPQLLPFAQRPATSLQRAPRFSQRPTSFGSAMPASDAGAGFVQ